MEKRIDREIIQSIFTKGYHLLVSSECIVKVMNITAPFAVHKRAYAKQLKNLDLPYIQAGSDCAEH